MIQRAKKGTWQHSLAGGFAYMTAPFAVHPYDRQRAKEAVKLARASGVTEGEFVEEARSYLKHAVGWPTDVSEQIGYVRQFIKGKL
ncbi:MAG: hypothetical protein AAF559_13050 [Pseudomonadota bacterium]